MTPITQKFIQQRLLGLNLGAQTTPAGGMITDNNDGNAADGGKFRHFALGSIYWKANLGARELHGSIFNKYRDLGFEYPSGTLPGLGFPISDQKPGIVNPANGFSEFEHGVLYLRNNTNITVALSPVIVPHIFLEEQLKTIVRAALSGTMTGGITLDPNSIVPRITNVLPYEYHQLSYPAGGRSFEVFTNRRYRIVFNVTFTGTVSGTIRCEIFLEFKTNPVGQLVFVLRDFRFALDFPLSIITWCIGGTIDDSIIPMCNQETVINLPPLPTIPAGSKFLCAHINTPIVRGSGNPRDLLLYIEPAS